MAIERIESYKQKDSTAEVLKIILRPTEKFPNSYFYTDANDKTNYLLNNYSWHLSSDYWNTYVCAHVNSHTPYSRYVRFHREYAYEVLGFYPEYIDHISGVELDNRNVNMNVVTNQYNSLNKPSKGYKFDPRRKNSFSVRIFIGGREKTKGLFTNEADCLEAVYLIRKEEYPEYTYDFFKDRRGDLDIVDLQLTGQISEEEAVYRHVVRYAKDNAWYVLRYNLFDYFKDNHIHIPSYFLDEQGFMVHPITGQKLCPF